MFKKLREVAEGRITLLTARSTEAWLERKLVPTLFVILDEEMEVLTSSKERNEHFKTASPWLKEQLDKWENPDISRVNVATPEHPLEVVTGDIALILVIESKKYLLSIFRDIPPIGWLSPGGCPRTKKELLKPRVLASRECAEEVLISDKEGRVYNLYPSTEELEENIQAWKLIPREIVPLLPKELPSTKGNAQNLVMRCGGQETSIENVNVTIAPEIASVSITIFWKATLPVKLEDLRIFDGERLPDKTLLNRPVRLTDQGERTVAIFSRGHNILLAEWHLESARKRMFIP